VLKNNKGQIRVVEAFLSMLVVFSGLAICSSLSPASNKDSTGGIAARGMQALVQLDSDGHLAEMIEQRNWTALSDALRLVLPRGVSYNLTIYDENLRPINDSPIRDGNLNDDVALLEYLCITINPQYQSYILRLQLATVK
jgi:hypothetical protein